MSLRWTDEYFYDPWNFYSSLPCEELITSLPLGLSVSLYRVRPPILPSPTSQDPCAPSGTTQSSTRQTEPLNEGSASVAVAQWRFRFAKA